jgi:hypothetical protein
MFIISFRCRKRIKWIHLPIDKTELQRVTVCQVMEEVQRNSISSTSPNLHDKLF